MSSAILHVSGPPGSGKTRLIRHLTSFIPADRIHHIRFDLRPGPSKLALVSSQDRRILSHHCSVRAEAVFETFRDVLRSFDDDAAAMVVMVETDHQPCFRHAYPFDVKAFIMSPPARLDDVFRAPEETAGAIDRAMHDTGEFAAEFFGLSRIGPQDSATLPAIDFHEHGDECSIEEFMQSPIGVEIQARLQLRPGFQGVADADVAFLNTAVPHNMSMAVQCAARIESILEPLRLRLERRIHFAACDPLDQNHPLAAKGISGLAALLAAARLMHS